MNVGQRPIADINGYNTEMAKSLFDKVFFVDKIKADVIIDIGCADGSLIKFLANVVPDIECVGYDTDIQMIRKAVKNYSHSSVDFTFSLPYLSEKISQFRKNGKTICIVLSSMIHEVYSYGPENIGNFWAFVWGLDADYVAIRDMMVSSKASRPASKRNAMRVRQIFAQYVDGKDMIEQHESQWGALEENWSLTHFLLKYRYVKNWRREVHENYLPISVEDFMSIIPPAYDISYFEHYILPFIAGEVWRDFYIQMQDPTHVKMVLRKSRKTPRPLFGDKS